MWFLQALIGIGYHCELIGAGLAALVLWFIAPKTNPKNHVFLHFTARQWACFWAVVCTVGWIGVLTGFNLPEPVLCSWRVVDRTAGRTAAFAQTLYLLDKTAKTDDDARRLTDSRSIEVLVRDERPIGGRYLVYAHPDVMSIWRVALYFLLALALIVCGVWMVCGGKTRASPLAGRSYQQTQGSGFRR
jgi:hypothetical protein